MIFKWFLRHQWKEMTRSSFWQKNVVINIILGLLIMIMLLYLLMIGIFIDKILLELYPDENPVFLFNGILIYYFAFEFFFRFYMQSLPTLNIESYLHLPVKKSSIVHYVTLRTVFVIGNYLTLLVVIPFALKVILPAYSMQQTLGWLAGFFLLVFANNFLAVYIKRQLAHRASVVAIFGVAVIALLLLDYFNVVSLTALSSRLFLALIQHPVLVTVPVVLVVFTYLLNYFFLKERLYPDEVKARKEAKIDSLSNIRYLKSLGLTGQLISLDLRLIWRHKRTRTIVYMAPLFLGYGLFFYPNPVYKDATAFLIFVGIFMTGGMMMNYANYSFSYESNYFDNILANYKDLESYIRTKYLFAISISTVCYVLTIPYVFFGMDIFLINTMTYLYNLGFLSFLLFYIATFSKKRMDLSKSSAFNYQGLGASHWLAMLPAFLLPVIIYLPFQWTGYPKAGMLFIGAVGVTGLLFNKSILRIVIRKFMQNRYSMAEGFRE